MYHVKELSLLNRRDKLKEHNLRYHSEGAKPPKTPYKPRKSREEREYCIKLRDVLEFCMICVRVRVHDVHRVVKGHVRVH